jgi:hypothetical protein
VIRLELGGVILVPAIRSHQLRGKHVEQDNPRDGNNLANFSIRSEILNKR